MVTDVILAPDGVLYKQTDTGPVDFDFNAEYRGFYPRCSFTAAAACKAGFFLAGLDENGRACLFSSVSGNAWTEAEMTPADYPSLRAECGKVLAILDSPVDSTVFLVCENGFLVTLPGCPKCVKQTRYAHRFTGAHLESGNVIVSCEDGECITVMVAALQQLRTSWSYALPALRDGALLYDLRLEEDAVPPLPNAIYKSVQAALLAVKSQPQSQTVFFFCYSGAQADTVTQYARFLGHMNAFSLGCPEHLLSKNGGVWPESL